ncbi:MAG: DUF4132 domain-containing protein [uncultured Sulfurovum sp.]|uniref:DUF4132 domain-containing protein n=1 Tax=uncultured Sulfurovum sp. TaxID=269237 RepID=A0A6S6TYU5_9BACT|nr:MAG: DUF4132 domain-containing protein [uncultured Sulfurovum sp.]
MIKQEEAEYFFKARAIDKPNLGQLIGFGEQFRQLGKIISLSTKEHKENNKKPYGKSRNINEINMELFTELFEDKDYAFNPFESKEGEALALYFFGEVIGLTLVKVWSKMNELPYQDGYARRSFRMKEPDEHHLKNKLAFLQSLYQLRVDKKSSALFNMSVLEIVQYMGYTYNYYLALPLSIYLEKENQDALQALVWDIFLAEDEIGMVTSSLIRGLLLSNKKESWEMVGKLLLSAQRQEGLRQTILEVLDETSVGALDYMIKLILEHNLYRFSSVVRAVDTWFGFGWEAPKKATIKRVLELSSHHFDKPEEIEKRLKKSRDNLEIYVALWAKSVLFDVDEANLLAIEMIKNDKTREKKLLACMFMHATNRTDHTLLEWIYENFGLGDVILDYYMLYLLPNDEIEKTVSTLFERIKTVALSVPKDGVSLKGKVFEWQTLTVESSFFYRKILNNASEDILKELGQDIVLLPSLVRETYVKELFPNYFVWGWDVNGLQKKKPKPLDLAEDSWKREVLYQALVDKNTAVQATGLNILNAVDLYEKEYDVIELLFKRKSKFLRQFLIDFTLKQEEKVLSAMVDNIIVSKDVSQRLGGLEILTQLHGKNKMTAFVKKHIEHYQNRLKISKNEEVLLNKFSSKEEELNCTHANGYGVVDYEKLQPLYKLEDKFSGIDKTKNVFDAFMDSDKTLKAINNLIALFKKHQNHEYAYEGWNGESETQLLINGIERTKRETTDLSKEEKFKLLPLYKVWEQWYKDSNLNEIEMMVAYGATKIKAYKYIKKPSEEIIARYYPELEGLELKIENNWRSFDRIINDLIFEVIDAYCDRVKLTSFQLDIIESMMINFPKQQRDYSSYRIASELENYWDLEARELELIERKWKVSMRLFYAKQDKKGSMTSTELAKKNKNRGDLPHDSFILRLYREGLLNEHDFLYHLLVEGRSFIKQFELKVYKEKDPFFKFSEASLNILKPKYAQLKENFLEIELTRGDKETEVSEYIDHFAKIEGNEYFSRILALIGKSKLNTHVLSEILRKTKPKEDEKYEDFETLVKPLKLTKNRWLEVAMYLPQWADWIGILIKLEALEDAVWWFQAHASDKYYLSDEDKAIISKYSAISNEDFGRGALDIDWFNEVYSQIGKANWRILTEFAKYTNGGHRLVKLYSSIILGEVKIREIGQKVKTKRDKDYLRGLGLVPLSKKTPQKDLLNRYNIFQTFLKESKQFGAQRQESEKNAVEIGMDNLSRTAGYSDSIRLSLAMEAKATNEIMEKSILTFNEVVLSLKIDDFGKADIFVEKEGKSQKSIPAKLKKEKAVKELVANKSYLKKQYSRVLKFLEESMVTEEQFSVEELESLMAHPVVKALLSKLIIWVDTGEVAVFDSSLKLVAFDDNIKRFDPTATCLIAHASHLHENNTWSELQKFAFDSNLIQPFKQIFRELYLLTEDEKEKAIHSKRYEGHQVQVQKTVALLKTRGWKVDYDEGLHKAFYKKGYVARIYAMADWYSPSDVEAPTLEQVSFESLKNGKNIQLMDVNKVIFSEVMRDMDLVVSVAHVGGVDPEASHSTLEMRAVLAKESARLFKLENVEVKERHMIIEGKLATYSVHLGSGIISKEGLSLSIIPVHSQHRGRLFLPFIDDDPKSAEIISKMKLLAEDEKIQDPTILSQILG